MHQEKAAGAARHSSIMFDSSTRGEERSPRHAMAKKDETIKDCVCVCVCVWQSRQGHLCLKEKAKYS